MTEQPLRRPSRLLLNLEIPRVTWEFWAYVAARAVVPSAPAGDDHGVLVVPGFMVGDRSTWPLRAYLRRLGYDAPPWRLGRNLGPTPTIIAGLPRRLQRLRERTGQRVSVVGVSLGGVFARDLARRHPDLVRQVITLASPFRLPAEQPGGPLTHAEGLYRALHRWHDHEWLQRGRVVPPSVPCTAIYTRTDGVVPWRACVEPGGPTRQSIEVCGSHSGLGHNPLALAVIADRLAQPEDGWRPFRWAGCTRGAVLAGARTSGSRDRARCAPRDLTGARPDRDPMPLDLMSEVRP